MSADNDEAAFAAYYGAMPWAAVPYEHREVETRLSATNGVKGIPTLLVFDAATGAKLSDKGREGVSGAPEGLPWAPILPPTASVLDALALFPELVRADGTSVAPASLRGAPFALYFSAQWCGPCKQFSPVLAGMYKALRARGVAMEVVFVSSDRSAADFGAYFAGHPWLALPYAHAAFAGAKEWLSDKCEVEGIPTLAVFDGEGRLLHGDAAGRVRADALGARFPWPPRAVEDLEAAMDAINAQPMLLALVDGLAHPHELSPPALLENRYCDLCREEGRPVATCAACSYDECAECSAAVAARGGSRAASAATIAAVAEAMEAVAAPFFAGGSGGGAGASPAAPIRFAIGGSGRPAASVRMFCGLDHDAAAPAAVAAPRFVIIDVPKRRKALLPAALGGDALGLGMPAHAGALKAWVDSYLAGSGESRGIKEAVGAAPAAGAEGGEAAGGGHSHGGKACGGHGH